jgi:hypothetical protein
MGQFLEAFVSFVFIDVVANVDLKRLKPSHSASSDRIVWA